MNIVEKVDAIRKIIADANALLIHIQNNECVHANYVAIYDGYQCTYDGDEYWVTLKCPDCGWSAVYDSEVNGERVPEYYADHPRKEYKR